MSSSRKLGSIALLLVLGVFSPRGWAQTAEDYKRSVVRITASDGTSGSGFVVEVSPEAVFLVSVSHILENGDASPSVRFEIAPRNSYTAVIEDTEAGAEGLALLRVSAPFPSGLAALPAAQGVIEIGQSIQVVGFPYSMDKRFSMLPGSIASRAGSNIRIAAAVGDGNSGGPVLSNGGVVGIVTRGGAGLGTATLASIVKIYLEGNDVDWGSSTTVRPPALTPKPTVTLTVEPDRITKGKSATLRWSTTNADTATLDHGIGKVALSGSHEVFPTETTTYNIEVTGEGGTEDTKATVRVELPKPTVTLKAEPSRIERGGRAILRWSSENALTASISPGIGRVPTRGSREVLPTLTATYRISVTGEVGTAEAEATITVLAPTPGTAKTNPTDGLKYVWIPPGTFEMGCSPGDNVCQDYEKPRHAVTISKGFWLGQTEVTVGAYRRFAEKTGGKMPTEPNFRGRALNAGWGDEGQPIVDVTWDEARTYCEWAGGRLPSEAEWEHAARAGIRSARYGDLKAIAWYGDNSGNPLDSRYAWEVRAGEDSDKYWEILKENGNRMQRVGLKQANSWGLYDTLGNVSEWSSDWYSEEYYAQSPGTDPRGPDSGTLRVLRGGSCFDAPVNLRASYRYGSPPVGRFTNIGFRCAREVSP